MAANPTVKCPTCKQDNAPDMAFCIFCGAGMKLKGASGVNPAVQDDDGPIEADLKVCPKCQCADPLNRDFCVICGTKIPKRERIKGVTSSIMVQSELQSLKEDISTIQAVRLNPNAPKPFRVPNFVIFFGLALMGSGLGALAGWYQLQQPDNTTPQLALPPKGLAILTAVPFCDVFVEFQERRNFLIGKTGRTGDLALTELTPETYQVQVESPTSDDQVHLEAVVQSGKPTVIGGPPGKRLFDRPDNGGK